MKREVVLDRTDAPRRHVIINTKTDELGSDEMLSPSVADKRNDRLREIGEPHRWYMWQERHEAA